MRSATSPGTENTRKPVTSSPTMNLGIKGRNTIAITNLSLQASSRPETPILRARTVLEASSVVSEQPLLLQGHSPVPEDAPVFHGHGKFKAALQALKLLRQTSEQNRAQERERETEPAKEKVQEGAER
jgi:hypothetical protein